MSVSHESSHPAGGLQVAPIAPVGVHPARTEAERRYRNMLFAGLVRRGVRIDPAAIAAAAAELAESEHEPTAALPHRRSVVVRAVEALPAVPVAGPPAVGV
jgi:hypothetical protein